MAEFINGSTDLLGGSVIRYTLNTTTPGQAVIRKLIAGAGLSISYTGVDEGTGDVTISLGSTSGGTGGGTGGGGGTTLPTDIGTVTSVNMTVPVGLTVLGNPITTAGTLALSLTTGYTIPTIISVNEGVTAYSWGNHALFNYIKLTSPLTGLSITGGAITATDTVLEAFGKAQNQINSLIGGVMYKGSWNASTNSPSLASSIGTKGWYYIVSTAGSTSIDGVSDWKIGDWIIYNGTTWDKIDNTDAVNSVNGFTGAVVLTTTDIAEGTNLYYLDSRARGSISLTTTGTSGAATYSSSTGVLNIPIYNSMVYPGAGVAISTGSAWGTSSTGTANQLTYWGASNTLTGSTDLTWDNTTKVKTVGLGLSGYVRYAQTGWFDGFIQSAYGNFLFAANLRYNGTSFVYDKSGFGGVYQMDANSGDATILTAPTGTAGATVAPIARLRVLNSGRVLIGVSLPTDDGLSPLQVNGMIKTYHSTWSPGVFQSVFGNTLIGGNLYWDTSTYKYIANSTYGAVITMDSITGDATILTAPIGTGGTAATVTARFKVLNAGRTLIGATLPTDDTTSALQVTGTIRQTSVTSSLLKVDSTGRLVAAVAGTDYISSLTGYVPYTGATGAVNLNTQTLASGAITASGKITATAGGALFAGTNYDMYVDATDANTVNFGYNTNATVTSWINWVGYLGGVTQLRSLYIGDGQHNKIALFDASARSLTLGTTVGTGTGAFYTGSVSSSGNIVIGDGNLTITKLTGTPTLQINNAVGGNQPIIQLVDNRASGNIWNIENGRTVGDFYIYSNIGTATRMIITSTGNVTFGSTAGTGVGSLYAGTITGSSFVKTGGTSSQILMADGTVLTAGSNITISGGTISATSSSGTTTNSLILKADTGTTEGTDLYTFNGAAAKTLNIVAGTNMSITKVAGQWTINTSATTNTGTVTSVSVTTANGVSGSVATSTTTPAITLTLGAITPSSVAATGTVTGSNLSGTNTGDNAVNSLYSGLVSNATHTGDATGATALTVVAIRNISIPAVTTGNLRYNGSAFIWDATAYVSGTPWTSAGYLTTANSFYVGTTNISLGRTSAGQTLTGISIDGSAGYTSRWSQTGSYSSTDANDFLLNVNAAERMWVEGVTMTNGPTGDWWFFDTARHSNPTNHYGFQWATSMTAGNRVFFRNYTGGTGSALGTVLSWAELLHTQNYNSYSPTLTGSGASGTWGISITGTAGSETLATVTSRGAQTNSSITLPAGNGIAYGFWTTTTNYSISMGNTSAYQYGPVSDYSIKISMDGASGRGITMGIIGSTPTFAHNTTSGNTQISGTMTGVSFTNTSDARLKDVVNADGDVVRFTWKDKSDNLTHIGYIAQDIQKEYPDQVSMNADGYLRVNYIEILVDKVRRLEKELDQLKNTLLS